VSLDDDDLDLFGTPKSNHELSSLLGTTPERPSRDPTPTAKVGSKAHAMAENERKTVEVERTTLEAPDGYHDLYGRPGSLPWEKIAYAYRVLKIRTVALERAVFVARDVHSEKRSLPEDEAALGRAVHDAANTARLNLPPSAVAEIRAAMEALSSLSTTRDEIRRNAERQGAMASARRESAAASLDPVSVEESRALAGLEAAERGLEQAKAVVAAAEEALRSIPDPNAIEAAGPRGAVDAAHKGHAAAARATRDAALAYAEVRRRALLQMARVVEADREADTARVDAKRAARELTRREDGALRALREAYAKLGVLSFESALGLEAVPEAFAAVRARRDRIAALETNATVLRDLARNYDVAAAKDGATAALIVAAMLVAILVLIAVAS